MEEYTAQIKTIERLSPFQFKVSVFVYPVSELALYVDATLTEGSPTPKLHIEEYAFELNYLNGYEMSPLEELNDCFDAYHEHEYSENLNPRLRRLWKIAELIDALISQLLVEINIGQFWTMSEELDAKLNGVKRELAQLAQQRKFTDFK